MTYRAWKWMALATAALAAAVGVLVFHTFDPNVADSIFPRCAFLALTGLYCPGCGLTRALHALAHGDLPRALAMNAFVVISLPLLAMLVWFGDRVETLPAPVARVLYNGYAWVGTLLAFGVLRNVPVWPFRLLAPGGA